MRRPRLRSWAPLAVTSILGISALAYWSERGTGYVDLRLLSLISPERAVYLGSRQVSGSGDRVVREDAGRLSLTDGRGWSSKIYCEVQVRKDRITTVAVRVMNGEPRCECEIPAAESSPAHVVCR